MKNHTIYKATQSMTKGSKPRKLLPYYVILEDFKAPDSPCGVGHRFVGGWEEEWMRDLIYDTMVANNRCSHSKRQPRLRKSKVKDFIVAKDWTITDWLKRKHPDVLAYYEANGLEFDNDVVWLPPLIKPDVKGWSSMKAGEKHDYGKSVGCEYCIVKDSARSCPLHGWPEKSKARYYEMFPEERKA